MIKQQVKWLVFLTVLFALFASVFLYEAHFNQEVNIEDSPPVIREPLILEQCVVDVTAIYKDQRRCGKGVVIEKNGETFVLTTTMIFVDDFESITIEIEPNWIVQGELIHRNEICGLAAVNCEPGFNEGYPISDEPDFTPIAETTAVSNLSRAPVWVLDYLNDDWMLIIGVDDTYVGAPLINLDEITGLVIGQNKIDLTQAIAVGNRGITEFVDQVMDMTTPHKEM